MNKTLLEFWIALGSTTASLLAIISVACWMVGQRVPFLEGFYHSVSAHFRD